MLIQKFLKKKMTVIVAIVFILSLFALNLNALVKGKLEVNEANAWRLWIFGFHKKATCAYDFNGDGDTNDPGEKYDCCRGNGFNCLAVYL